ncbi:hypothetical protein ACIF6L_26780 [Kitasatospora sp. NPDC086009]|uniref:hypothetical protein n=1 Tax=unclassified Kitasatospora TaxID=2633591 RepID=UPI0037C92C1C
MRPCPWAHAGAPPDRLGLSCTGATPDLAEPADSGNVCRYQEHRDVTIPTINDPKGVVEQSPLSQGRSYEGRIGSRPVTFTAGRQGWWNHTSLNAQ